MTSLQVDGTPTPSPTQTEGTRSGSINPIEFLRHRAEKQQEAVWISWVEEQYQKAKTDRAPFERQWHLNLAFYAGKQYIAPINVAGQGFRLTVPKAPPWRVRLVINKIRVAVRTECAKLTSNKPIPVVIPATNEDEDYASARIAERIVNSYFLSQEFDRTMKSFAWWGSVTGNAYLKSYWSADAIDSMTMVMPQQIPGLQGFNVPDPIPVPARGKIVTERLTPFHVFVPDLLEEDIQQQPWVMHVSTKSPDWVKRHFGITVTPDARASSNLMEAAILNPVGAGTSQNDSVLVKEIWIKPGGHPDFPEGGVLTVCQSHMLQKKQGWPLSFPEYPFYKYDGMPTGGFYTESVVTDLIPLQKEYNKTKSQMIEIKNTMGKPKFLAQRGSINPRQVSSEPGQAILYTPGFEKPTILPPAEVPATMQVELDRLNSDFDDISGQHEITRGNTPSQVTSGTAISFLQEQDDSKLSYQVASIERVMSLLGTHYLKYATLKWGDDRLVKIVGRDGEFEARHWKSSSLRGNTDVRIESGSGLPVSKAARQALITDFMTQGILDPQTGLEILDLGGLDKAIEDVLIDKRQAQRENMKMAEANPQELAALVNPPVGPDGQPIEDPNPNNPSGFINPATGGPWQPQPPMPVNSYDNHQAHIFYHNQFRKTQQFELLPDEVKKAFELHVQAHQYALAVPQMGSAGMLPGAAPSGGEPQQQPQGEPNNPAQEVPTQQ